MNVWLVLVGQPQADYFYVFVLRLRYGLCRRRNRGGAYCHDQINVRIFVENRVRFGERFLLLVVAGPFRDQLDVRELFGAAGLDDLAPFDHILSRQ